MEIVTQRDVSVRMRDGTLLYADVYYPGGREKLPALVMRLPYDKTSAQSYVYAHPSWYARHGYVVVVQDTRGRGRSEGEFYPFLHEMEDGYDTVEWAAGLPACNGRVGMYGFSYVGWTQWMAALMRPPHLVCICPAMVGSQVYDGWVYNSGAFSLSFAVSWAMELAAMTAHRKGLADVEQALLQAFARTSEWCGHLPLADMPPLKDTGLTPYFFDWMSHPAYDDYWRRWSLNEHYGEITVPALNIAGWYDVFRDGSIENYSGARSSAATEQARQGQKLLIGPWYHVPWTQWVGQGDFGEQARNVVDQIQLRWFDYWLKSVQNGIMQEPPVQVFVLGANSWRQEQQWPPAGVRYQNWYLHSQDRANSLNGDGVLDQQSPNEEPADVYVYDPHGPVPSLGGHSCCFPAVSPMGPACQLGAEMWSQVLVYSGPLLQEDVLVAGPVDVSLWASSSAVDTDWTAKLVDVHPDGRAINVTEGILRARYRESLEQPSLLIPGQVYSYSIRLGHVCNLFKAGHRIRLEVSSSNFPHWDRNTNTGRAPGWDTFTDLVVATQTVFHDAVRPSHLTLPVVPGR